jgi:hypothetical protein
MAMMAGAGTLGAGGAGLIGGLAYGFIAATPPLPNGGGAASSVFVLLWLTLAVALVGGAGVSLGIAIAETAGKRPWLTLGGAAGGMIVGAVVKLLGIDAFNLLFGQSPAAITGGLEGLFLGAGVGLGATLSSMGGSDRSFALSQRGRRFAAVRPGALSFFLAATFWRGASSNSSKHSRSRGSALRRSAACSASKVLVRWPRRPLRSSRARCSRRAWSLP